MKVFNTINSLQSFLSKIDKNIKIGFVPTMGALHNGHLSLLSKASSENEITVVSIFVNPTQFDKKEDLDKYPQTLQEDLKMLELEKCDVVFVPSVKEMYQSELKPQNFEFGGLENVMEGAFRKGHFDGVGTIVKKLLEIVNPTNAYFGEKDFQQLQIIKKMVEIENMKVNIIGCEIFREDDGLAMSSRNSRLSKEQREAAPLIYQTLLKTQKLFPEKDIESVKNMVKNTFENHLILKLEYFDIADTETLISSCKKENDKKYRGFIAVYADTIRLIDNIALN
ncbi:MAG: pantoate--beta-alanine ligase [Bacteroidota bacterium]